MSLVHLHRDGARRHVARRRIQHVALDQHERKYLLMALETQQRLLSEDAEALPPTVVDETHQFRERLVEKLAA